MKQVTDYAPFAEGKQLLDSLQVEFDRALVDLEEVRKQLRENNISIEHKQHDPLESAAILLKGESIQANKPSDDFKLVQDKEIQLRDRVEQIRSALNVLPMRVERLRDQAATERKKELGPEFNKVRAQFADAVSKLLTAIDAEDKLRNDMVLGGFGCSEAVLTSPIWLNRDLLLLNRARLEN